MDKQEYENRVAQLYEDYAEWFDDERKRWGMWELSGIPGWFSIIEQLLASIRATLKPELARRFRLMQIKEKFGSLRVYYEGQAMFMDSLCPTGPACARIESEENPFKEIDGLISEATGRSTETCIFCGDVGRIRTDGWWLTMCDFHQRLHDEGKTLKDDFELMTQPESRH